MSKNKILRIIRLGMIVYTCFATVFCFYVMVKELGVYEWAYETLNSNAPILSKLLYCISATIIATGIGVLGFAVTYVWITSGLIICIIGIVAISICLRDSNKKEFE